MRKHFRALLSTGCLLAMCAGLDPGGKGGGDSAGTGFPAKGITAAHARGEGETRERIYALL